MSILTIKTNVQRIGSIRIALAILFIVSIAITFTHTLDSSSSKYIDKAFNRALITFAIAKTLNGVISVAQGTEIAIQPAGIGINLTPGQILDPVNDLVERFSWVMLVSTTSLGIQKVFLTMSIWPAFNYLLISILTLGLILLFMKQHSQFRLFILRLSLLLIVLRFIVPITALANQGVYHVFLETEYTTSTKKLENAADEIEQINSNQNIHQPNIRKKSVWESAKEFYKSTSEMVDINKRIERYKYAATQTTRHVVNLIVVFLFQTLIIPLVFFFILYALFKYITKLNLEF